ncbi:MAG: helix-turn-helix domain-containing protein [Azonexus sp.]|jgi:transcriptional regulator with XRE-family HTH domain|nr:helix-turn-helix domain-containing protein [Azonexus sp.]
MTISERLKTARATLGLSQKEFAAQSGVSARGYQGYEDGRSVPGGEAISSFVRLGINANWLLTGEGQMLLAAPPEALKPEPPPGMEINEDALKAVVAAVNTVKPNASQSEQAALIASMYSRLVAEGIVTPQGIHRPKQSA